MSLISWFECPNTIFALRKALVPNFSETSELTRYRRVQYNKVADNDNATDDWRFPSKLCPLANNKRSIVYNVAQTFKKYFATWYFLRKVVRGYRNIFIPSSNLSTIVILCQFKRALARRSRLSLSVFLFLFFLMKNKVVNNYTLSKFAIFYASSFISIRAFVIFTGWW